MRPAGLRIKENKEVYEGEVTELTPEEMETEGGGYGKVRAGLPLLSRAACMLSSIRSASAGH